ncbi:MAG: class I SAM-dependent methyltransferase [Thermodesulfobacteriota bacterium]
MDASKQEQYKERYKANFTPWDIGRPDFNLVEMVNKRPIEKGKALDVGCGSGHNSIWLAQNEFTVTGVDVSEIALQKAKENASSENIKCTFLLLDFFEKDVPRFPFNFIFDRGCFHSYDSDNERRKFAERVAHHLDKAGLWLSLVGSGDEPLERPGPPKRSARDIVVAVEPLFEILSITASYFDSNVQNPPKAWACLMKKR